MDIYHNIEIQNSKEVIWKQLCSLENLEKYLLIVTKSRIDKTGKNPKRISEISIGNQIYQIQETIQNLDETNHSFTTLIDEGPIQIKGMQFTYSIKSQGKNKSNLIMSAKVVNPDAQFMAQTFFKMMGQGLKKMHEL